MAANRPMAVAISASAMPGATWARVACTTLDRPRKAFTAAIEARVLAWLAGEQWLLDAFAKGKDAYRLMAADIYRKPADMIGKPSSERDMGKRVILGCGFGMGWKKFILTCAKDDVVIEDADAQRIIDTYRDKNARIKAFWYELERARSEER